MDVSTSYMNVLTHRHQCSRIFLCMFLCCIFIQWIQSSPSGLTPLTFLSQPHLSSSPRVQARVTATAMAAEDRACTKAASRVPESKLEMRMCESTNVRISTADNTPGHIFNVKIPWFMTLPNTLIPRGVVEQFQRRFLNWCWH